MNKLHGIDISRFQESDFRLSDKDIDFAILRIGGRDGNLVELFKDAQFDNYYAQTREIGLPTGAYYLGNAHRMHDRYCASSGSSAKFTKTLATKLNGTNLYGWETDDNGAEDCAK